MDNFNIKPRDIYRSYLIRINDILNSEYIRNDDIPDCIRFKNINVFKVLFVGFVIDVIDKNYIMIDDGSNNILVFHNDSSINHLDPVIVLGRIRLSNNQKMVYANFIKKINVNTIKFYKIKYNMLCKYYERINQPLISNKEEKIKSEIKHTEVLDVINDLDKLFKFGVPKNDIINELKKQGYYEESINKIIKDLLQKGEIFEIKKNTYKITKSNLDI